ncbi:MAG: sugar-binding domain-containing protein [Planctomycetota bacterium]
MQRRSVVAGWVVCVGLLCAAAEEWWPAKGPLMTRWAKQVTPQSAHREYPRPQLVRSEWLSLNGLWDYAVTPLEAPLPESFTGSILVPFPIESALSGVMARVGPRERLWYRRTFRVPEGWERQRVLLHFGAVDWETEVWVDGHRVGEHRGGYDPFTFDITAALERGAPRATGDHAIVVAVWDPTDAGYQARGKQVRQPHGIWYTPTTGIWQTVWLEPVGSVSIERLLMTPDIGRSVLRLSVATRGLAEGWRIEAEALAKGEVVGRGSGVASEPLELAIPDPILWSPASPFLYDLKVRLLPAAGEGDAVQSYFGMREIVLAKDASGLLRLHLNGEPLFQYGPLDQGFWPDGLYTAPSDEALRYDIEVLKRLGCNMARKHVKIEPDRWYTWCDRLGLLVWQDMPSGDAFIGGSDPDTERVAQSAQQFELELRRSIDALANHPCIVMWVIFNEGWGQYDTERLAAWVKAYDPSRLTDSASGWTDRGVGDVLDIHSYPGPASPDPERARAIVLGEFGGLGLPLQGHTWQDEKNWGYRSFESSAALTAAYVELVGNLRPLIAGGLAAAVYTQTTDVEIEVNGLMTYDRELVKLEEGLARAAADKLYQAPPVVRMLVPVAPPASGGESAPPVWSYTLEAPAEGWRLATFDDSSWKRGGAGFGRPDTPGARVHTEWTTRDIWLRRRIELGASALENPHLLIHHDEDVEVYANGKLILRRAGYTTHYTLVPLSMEAHAAFVAGSNTLAVHCHQTGGGQYIDLGIAEVAER